MDENFRQLKIVRSEISNIRQQLKSLKFQQNKYLKDIRNRLNDFKCEQCLKCDCLKLKPIGWITTDFPEKKSIPRQSTINLSSFGKVIFDKSILTNPNHALEGIENFSHIWLIYYFSELESNRLIAKVAPPRLNGTKLGVFATRSPHRPCPIGLSLVKLESVNVNSIMFSGVDMLDKTPILDIKPYIPLYDSSSGSNDYSGSETNDTNIPQWIQDSSILDVEFSEDALNSLDVIYSNEANKQKMILINILKEDPRSVYIRTRFGNNFYTFRNGNTTVSCQFNDNTRTVTVLDIQQKIHF